eukprot:3091998-Lingulodinium_polyedra.AAC.1
MVEGAAVLVLPQVRRPPRLETDGIQRRDGGLVLPADPHEDHRAGEAGRDAARFPLPRGLPPAPG